MNDYIDANDPIARRARLLILDDDDAPTAPAAQLPAPVTPAPQVRITRGGSHIQGRDLREGDWIARTSATAAEASEDKRAGLAPLTGAGIVGARAFREQAGLTWTYSLEPACRPDGTPVRGRKWIRRDDTNEIVGGPVSDSYGLLQLDSLDAIDALLGRGAVIDRGGVFDRGARVWLQTRELGADFTGPEGLDFQARAIVVSPYTGTDPWLYALSVTCVQCRNTYAHAIDGAARTFTLRHTSRAESRLREIERAAEKGGAYYAALRERLYGHAAARVSLDQVAKFVREDLFHANEEGITDRARSIRTNKADAFIDGYINAPGAAPGSVFGIDQAATYYASHVWNAGRFADDLERLSSLTDGGAAEWETEAAEAVQQLYVRLVG